VDAPLCDARVDAFGARQRVSDVLEVEVSLCVCAPVDLDADGAGPGPIPVSVDRPIPTSVDFVWKKAEGF
jgi:hypothetical protein